MSSISSTRCKMETIIKRKRERVTRKLNKELYAAPGFEEFWDKSPSAPPTGSTLNARALVDAM